MFDYILCCYYPTLLSMDFNSLIISVIIYARRYARILLLSMYFFHILTNTKFQHVTFAYYHNLVFEFTLNVTYFHRVVDI